MNPCRRADDATGRTRRYRPGVLSRPAPRDWAIALTGAALTEWVVWTGTLGTHVAGPRWFTAGWPLLLDLPLAWRRLAPLSAWLFVLAGFAVHPLATGHSAEGAELLYPIGVGAYALAAYAGRRAAVVGLIGFVPVYLVHAFNDPAVRHDEAGGQWASAFFGAAVIVVWFAGFWIHSRREAAALAARATAAEREATAAVAEERARMARELHDIVSHNLSVVVLQAAGARAAGAGERTLEKIEQSGREALVEMRRLLGVLRENDANDVLAPQPGVADLERLAADVRAAGLPVHLSLDGDCTDLPPALQLNAYRIVQEALTNTLKHAGPARAQVHVSRADGQLIIEVSDNGSGAGETSVGGHGLIGMRERVGLFGGTVEAGPRAEGGFHVRASLPLQQ
jgi:signal transduction histidine kinase